MQNYDSSMFTMSESTASMVAEASSMQWEPGRYLNQFTILFKDGTLVRCKFSHFVTSSENELQSLEYKIDPMAGFDPKITVTIFND